MGNLTRCKIITISTCNCVGTISLQANCGFHSYSKRTGFSTVNKVTKVIILRLSSPTILIVLSFRVCPHVELLGRFYALWLKRIVSVQGDAFWGVKTMGDVIWASIWGPTSDQQLHVGGLIRWKKWLWRHNSAGGSSIWTKFGRH